MNTAKDTINLTGDFSLRVYKGDVLVEKYEDKNLVVAVGRSQVAAMIGGPTTDKYVSQIGFGENATAPASSDTALTLGGIIGDFIPAAVTDTYPAPGQVQFDWVLGVSEGNGVTIAEYGLICQDGTLFARKTRATIVKDSSIRLEGTWKITF